MKILVTGGSGFIGSRVVRTLFDRGHEVASLGNNPPHINGAGINKCIHLKGRIENPPWKDITNFSPEACIHSAWITNPGMKLDSEENELLAINSKNFLLQLETMGVNNLTVLGTCLEAATDRESMLHGTDSTSTPSHRYTRSKIQLHKDLLRSLSSSTILTWARIFYVYGSGEPPNKLFSSLIRQASNGNTMEIANPDNIVDYIHVNDVALALAIILEQAPGGIINVGTGQGVLLRNLAKKISCQLGCPDPPDFPAANKQKVSTFIVADNSRLKSLGWKPKTSLRTGIHDLIQNISNKRQMRRDSS